MTDQAEAGRNKSDGAGNDPMSHHAANEQLRELLAELARRRDFPDAETRDFMAHALETIVRLPPGINPPERVRSLLSLVRFYNLEDEIERSTEVADLAVNLAVDGGYKELEAQARWMLASRLRLRGNMFESLREFEKSLEITRGLGDSEGEAKILNNLGN